MLHVHTYMIDILRISIPFLETFVAQGVQDALRPVGLVDLVECARRGCKLESGQVIPMNGIGQFEVDKLRHPYESLPSSNSTLSFKIFKGGDNYWPHIEIKASPAKLLQGHNVFGTDNIRLAVESLVTSFTAAMPSMCDMLDFRCAELKQIDCTFFAKVKNDLQSRAVIMALRSLSSGQTRASKSAHETTVYWGKDSRGGQSSRHKVLKAYLKMPEILSAIEDLEKVVDSTDENSWQRRQLAALTSPVVQEFAQDNVRFEASVMPAMLKRLGFPTRVGDFVHHCEQLKQTQYCPIEYLWHESFKDIFKSFEGKQVNIYNDEEVRTVLRREYFKVTPKGKTSYAKADRLFRFVRALKNEGWDEVKLTTPESTFYDNVKLITRVVPKAFLINLQNYSESNVVPLVRLIDVDFSRQLPVGWVEPKTLTEQFRLRAVG